MPTKIEHNLETGTLDVREMTGQEIAALNAQRAAHQAAQEAAAAAPTPQKDVIAAMEAASNFVEMKPLLIDAFKLAFGLVPPPEPVVDDGVTITPQEPAEEELP